MRKLLLFSVIGLASLSLVCSASANVINVLGAGDFPANDISTVTGNPGLGDANVLAWLQAKAAIVPLPAPSTVQADYTGGSITAGDYLVLHYGAGRGGSEGGGLVALYFDADQASYPVPANGSGPNGFGGISFARLFSGTGNTVPDGGTTAALLAGGLSATAWLGRRRQAGKK